MLLFLVACSTSADCPACPDCPPCEAPALTLEAWEAELLAPVVEDLRAGIVPHGEEPFGICRGRSKCDEYLGPSPGALEPGDYLVRAEVQAPAIGEGWKVSFEVSCVTTRASGDPVDHDHDRIYDVVYTGASHGYRLQPLWKIQSPHPSGARECTYSLTPQRPDGTDADAWTGAYSTPAPTDRP